MYSIVVIVIKLIQCFCIKNDESDKFAHTRSFLAFDSRCEASNLHRAPVSTLLYNLK